MTRSTRRTNNPLTLAAARRAVAVAKRQGDEAALSKALALHARLKRAETLEAETAPPAMTEQEIIWANFTAFDLSEKQFRLCCNFEGDLGPDVAYDPKLSPGQLVAMANAKTGGTTWRADFKWIPRFLAERGVDLEAIDAAA